MIYQQNYIKERLKRFETENANTIDIHIVTVTRLDTDEIGPSVDENLYRCMIGPLLYSIARRPDIVFIIAYVPGSCQIPMSLTCKLE